MEAGSPRTLCLDTDILIDYLRGPSEEAMKLFEAALAKGVILATTCINAYEIWLGAFLSPKPEEKASLVAEFLTKLVILDLDYGAAVEAARIMAMLRRKGMMIDVRGLLAGSIAKENGIPMITGNVKHYARIPGLRVMTPEEAVKMLATG